MEWQFHRDGMRETETPPPQGAEDRTVRQNPCAIFTVHQIREYLGKTDPALRAEATVRAVYGVLVHELLEAVCGAHICRQPP